MSQTMAEDRGEGRRRRTVVVGRVGVVHSLVLKADPVAGPDLGLSTVAGV